jgi:hypothetical protein
MRMRTRQRGLSMMGFLFVAAVVIRRRHGRVSA